MEEDRIVVIEDGKGDEKRNMLDAVYENGKRLKTESYSEVRSRIDAEHQKIHKKMQACHEFEKAV